jgi:hypothetical protein
VRQALEERAPVSEDLALIPQRGDVVVVAPEVLGLSSPVTSNGKPLTVCGRACTLRMPRKVGEAPHNEADARCLAADARV